MLLTNILFIAISVFISMSGSESLGNSYRDSHQDKHAPVIYTPQTPRFAEVKVIKNDLQRILKISNLPTELVDFEWTESNDTSTAIVECHDNKVQIQIKSPKTEWSSTLYYSLQKMGFLFPHPRIQISPTREEIFSVCGKKIQWQPRFLIRGFHLHTQHPNEWVQGFLMGQTKIAEDYLWWSVRNGQNVVQVKLLQNGEKYWKPLSQSITLAHQLGILFGLDVSFSSLQQRAYRLLDNNIFNTILASNFGVNDIEYIQASVDRLSKEFDFDYISAELGTSEFTHTDAERTLKWIDEVHKALIRKKRGFFIKGHVSTGQIDEKYGNFNFLPQFANPLVGIQPHTVMYYGLGDKSTPVYGRQNFDDIFEYMKREVMQRPTWYFPETSYWVAMDMDIPLFLTDYFLTRSSDMDQIESIGVNGHITFTTGQEGGYWLFDWTTALLTNSDYRNKPMIGLELLGEDVEAWKKVIEFQHKYIKEAGLLAILSSQNLMDELPGFTSVHKRVTLSQLLTQPQQLRKEMTILKEALPRCPKNQFVKNEEVRLLLDVTCLRIDHALRIRRAIEADIGVKTGLDRAADKTEALLTAKELREKASEKMQTLVKKYQRYPEARIFADGQDENLTSYNFGYLWTAASLHFWEREEKMILTDSYDIPLFMNIYDPRRILN